MNRIISPTEPLMLSPALAGTLMTPEEFDACDDAEPGYRYELIQGVLIVTPPPGEGERVPNDLLGYLLYDYQEHHPEGSILDGTAPEQTLVTPTQRRRADRVIWTGLGRVPDPAADVPSIVIEFVSAARRDRRRDYEAKRAEYLAAGVREYWVIDRFLRKLTVVRARPGAGADAPEEIVVAADGTYATPLLPGFELPLARLLRAADDWSAPR